MGRMDPLVLMLLASVVTGLAIGRWRAVALPVLAAVGWLLYLAASGADFHNPQEDASGGVIGLFLVLGLIAAFSVGVGVFLRKLKRHE